MKQVPTSIYHLNVQVPEKLDLFLNKYFPPVERSKTSAMCVTLQQVHLNLYHPCIADTPPPLPSQFPLFWHQALTPFTPGHDSLSSPPSTTTSSQGKISETLLSTSFGGGCSGRCCSRSAVNWNLLVERWSGGQGTTRPGIPMGKFLLALPPHNYINQNQNTKYKTQNTEFKFQNTKFLLALHWPNYINKYLNY